MADAIADEAVALSLMFEALRLLDGPEHDRVAALLRRAIDELSPEKLAEPPLSRDEEEPSER